MARETYSSNNAWGRTAGKVPRSSRDTAEAAERAEMKKKRQVSLAMPRTLIREQDLPQVIGRQTIAIEQIKTHPTFVELLPVDEDLLEKMIRDMRANGYYDSEPIVLGVWPRQEEPVLIDGHMRIRAASEAGITQVPSVTVEFANELDALQHAINLQTVRRISTDGAFYRLCEQYDRLMGRGRLRKSEESKELLTRVSNFVGRSASARRTAALIGCHYRKVDKIRKIRRDGAPQIQEDVKNDRIGINKAYKLIRDMELGSNEATDKVSVAQVKAAKALFNEENLAILTELGGDLSSHANRAAELYIRRLQDKERTGKGNGS
jgi:ParB-like chromosome segregation protein Spo0J